jgi:hypothetical protein
LLNNDWQEKFRAATHFADTPPTEFPLWRWWERWRKGEERGGERDRKRERERETNVLLINAVNC